MAHLWIQTCGGEHGVLTLELDQYELPAAVHRVLDRDGGAARAAMLLRVDRSSSWTLVVDRNSAVEVNGAPVTAGLRVLEDRDEIRLAGGAPIWFSTESLARVEPAPAFAGRKRRCPRCSDPIEAGSPAVCCPRCGVFSHEQQDRACFTYQKAPCAACGEFSELDGSFHWTPEGL